MTTRRFARIAGLLFGVGFLLSVVIATIVWLELRTLPSYRERYPSIGKPIAAIEPSQSLGGGTRPLAASEPTDIQVSPRRPASIQSRQQLTAASSVVPPEQPQVIGDYLVQRFVQGTDPGIRVCSLLQGTRGEPFQDPASFTSTLENVAQGNSFGNPYVESVIAPMAFALSRPSVQRMVQSVRNSRAAADPDQLRTEEFKSQLSLATSELVENQRELNRVAQIAYHLFVLTRAVNLSPETANDTETMTLCNRLEDALAPGTQVDIDQEKTALLRFLALAGVSPQEAGFVPSLENEVRIETSSQWLVLRVPWIERLFAGQLGARRATGTPAAE